MRCPHRPPLPLVALIAALTVQATASAHPFGDDEYAHRIVLRLHEASLGLEYSVEVPAQVIMQRFAHLYGGGAAVGEQQDEEFAAMIFAELADHLTLRVDGELVPLDWEPVPDVPNAVGTGRFFVYHLRASAPLSWSAEGLELLLTNDNAVADAAYYSGWIFADPGIAVQRSSLEGMGAAAAGGDVFNAEGAWSRDPVYRDVAATVAPARPEPPPQQGRGFPWWIAGIPLVALAAWGIGTALRRRRQA